jgi:hypothetical protein
VVVLMAVLGVAQVVWEHLDKAMMVDRHLHQGRLQVQEVAQAQLAQTAVLVELV